MKRPAKKKKTREAKIKEQVKLTRARVGRLQVAALAYAGGMFDAESWIGIGTQHDKRDCGAAPRGFYPVLGVNNTHLELLTPLQAAFGGYISHRKTCRPNEKIRWTWELTGDSVLPLLRKVLPHMKHIDKIRRTRLLLQQYMLCVEGRANRYEFVRDFLVDSAHRTVGARPETNIWPRTISIRKAGTIRIPAALRKNGKTEADVIAALTAPPPEPPPTT